MSPGEESGVEEGEENFCRPQQEKKRSESQSLKFSTVVWRDFSPPPPPSLFLFASREKSSLQLSFFPTRLTRQTATTKETYLCAPPPEKFPFSASISPLFPPPFGALVPFLSGPKAGRTSPQKKKKKSPLSLIENSVWLSGTKASLCSGKMEAALVDAGASTVYTNNGR